MEHLKSIIKCIFSGFVNFIIYIISLLVPKSKKIFLFGGWFGKRFADNSRYLYLYCNEFKDKLGLKKVIWITENDEIYDDLKSNGFEVYKKWSLKSIWYHFRASVVFVDQGATDVNKYFTIRSKRINLWHGFPIKKIGRLTESIDYKLDSIYNRYFKIGGWSNFYLQATSKLSKSILKKSFNVEEDKMIISGYSRNDVFTEEYWKNYISKKEQIVLDYIKEYKLKGYKILFYLPTFRDNKEISLLNIQSKEESILLENFLEQNKIILITKFHFAQSDNNKNENLLNIVNLESNVDVYPILNDSDILITDYSSVYFDFLVSNKPIIFYPFDLEYYSNPSLGRGLIFDYEEFTPGPKLFNLEDLLNSIKDISDNPKDYYLQYEKQYKNIKNKVFEENVLNGSENLIEQVIKKVL